jgi:hypothetical protein
MTLNLSRLVSAGFEVAGQWYLSKDSLELDLHPTMAAERDVLYAFAVNGALVYVGKTTLSLRERMQRYKTPAKNSENGGSTNIKNNNNILVALRNGQEVKIFILRILAQHRHGEFLISVTAGLEDNLIAELAPPWNGRSAITRQVSSPSKVIRHAHSSRTEQRLTKVDFQIALDTTLDDANKKELSHVDIRSGTLHTKVGAYPGPGHSMPTCCNVMYSSMRPGDEVREAPPKGRGANLVIRYKLPR